MLAYTIMTVSLVLVAVMVIVVLVRRAHPSDDVERLLGRDWWPRFEHQFAEHVDRLREGRA